MTDDEQSVSEARAHLSDYEDLTVEEKHGAIKHAIDRLKQAKRELPDDY